jgi:hypothetical protein
MTRVASIAEVTGCVSTRDARPDVARAERREAVAGSSTARATIVSETQMTAAASTIVNHAIARMRRSIELSYSTVNASPSPWAATSSWRPILNASPNVM